MIRGLSMSAVTLLLVMAQREAKAAPTDVDKIFEEAYKQVLEKQEKPAPDIKQLNLPSNIRQLPQKYRLEQPWQGGTKCGPVALYLMIALQGREVRFEDVCKHLPEHADGSSLDELQQAGAHYGLKLRAVQVTPEQLKTLPMPCIVHWTIHGQSEQLVGHFDVLLRHIDGVGYDGVNTTHCLLTRYGYQSVAPQFDGYALILDKDSDFVTASLWTILGIVIVANVCYAAFLWWGKPATAKFGLTSKNKAADLS